MFSYPNNSLIIKKQSLIKFIFAATFILAFLSPPFIFEQMGFSSRNFRLYLGIVTMLLLISRIIKIKIYDLIIFIYVIFLFSVELLRQVSDLNNILSYYAVVGFCVLLFIALRNSEVNRKIFLKLWIQVGYFISISTIILFVLHQFTSFNTDFFNFASLGDFSKRTLRFSFLGTTAPKHLGPIVVARSYGYFFEPQMSACYFTLNILLASCIDKIGKYRKWYILNLMAGFLTFSATFYLTTAVIYVMQIIKSKKILILVSIVILTFVIPLLLINEDMLLGVLGIKSSVIDMTSYDDREVRLLIALDILKSTSLFDFLFGHGVGYNADADRALSSGFFYALVERGLTGLLFVLTMMTIFLRRDIVKCLVCLLYLFALPWYTSYIYWMGFLVLWVATYPAVDKQSQNEYEKT